MAATPKRAMVETLLSVPGYIHRIWVLSRRAPSIHGMATSGPKVCVYKTVVVKMGAPAYDPRDTESSGVVAHREHGRPAAQVLPAGCGP